MNGFAVLKNAVIATAMAVAIGGCAKGILFTAEDSEAFSVSLEVYPPFDPAIFYQVVNSDACRLVYNPAVPRRGGNIHDTPYQAFLLSQKQCATIREQTRVTLHTTPPEIDRPGFDGSIWLLSSSSSQGLGITAWEPTHAVDERGYVELLRLRGLLDQIIDNREGSSYGGEATILDMADISNKRTQKFGPESARKKYELNRQKLEEIGAKRSDELTPAERALYK